MRIFRLYFLTFLTLVALFSNASASATISYSLFLGGLDSDKATAIPVDTAGNIYIADATSSADFATSITPCSGTFDDIWVAKFNSSMAMVFSPCIGGTGIDVPTGMAVDSNQNVYLAGHTTSTNFPIVNAAQSIIGGWRDGFVLKLSASGAVIEYSTYLGGDGDDTLSGIPVNTDGLVYVAGTTTSSNLAASLFIVAANSEFATDINYCTSVVLLDGDVSPTVYCGNVDAFVAGLAWNGSLNFMHYMGGKGYDVANAIALDSSSSPVVVGTTSSTSFFPKVGAAFQAAISGGYDAFVTQYDYSGLWIASTYFGGKGSESANAVSVGPYGDIYVAGSISSTYMPILSPYKATLSGKTDVFVSELYPGLSALAYSTDIGGKENDIAYGIAVNPWGYASVTGIPCPLIIL